MKGLYNFLFYFCVAGVVGSAAAGVNGAIIAGWILTMMISLLLYVSEK